MRSNIIKYIFIVFAVFIIIFAIYKIGFSNDEEVIEEANEIKTVEDKESILNIGISDFDNINPLSLKIKIL